MPAKKLAASSLAVIAPAAAAGAITTPSIEIDQMVVNLPTTLSLKRHKSYFRITHRFARDLFRGSFGELAEDLEELKDDLRQRYQLARAWLEVGSR